MKTDIKFRPSLFCTVTFPVPPLSTQSRSAQVHNYAYHTQLFMMFCTRDWIWVTSSFCWSKKRTKIMIQESSLL